MDSYFRLYSQFIMWNNRASPADFDRAANKAVLLMNNCLKFRSLRSCVYDISVTKDYKQVTTDCMVSVKNKCTDCI